VIGFFRRLARDRSGVTAVEFALISGPMFTIILGSMDLARYAYASSVLQGTLTQAARKAGLEGASVSTVTAFVNDQLKEFAKPANIKLEINAFKEFTGIGKPEKITTDIAPIGTYNIGDCYVDANKNGVYDTQQGSGGIGSAEDAIRVKLTMDMNRLSPVAGAFGMGPTIRVERTTFSENEPYAGVVDPPTRCS